MRNKPEALSAFVQEARELLAAMETVLLKMALEGVDKAGVDAVFRAVHTIKGSASIFGFEHIVGFTHVTESVLDQVRQATVVLDETLHTLLLECNDHISSEVDAIAHDKHADPSDVPRQRALEKKLTAYLVSASPAADVHVDRKKRRRPAGKKKSVRSAALPVTGMFAKTPYWHVSLRFDRAVFEYGFNPVAFIAHLGLLGIVIDVHVVDELLPATHVMVPQQCYIGFEIVYQSDASLPEIVAVFDVIASDSTVVVIAPHSDIGAYQAVLANFKKPSLGLQVLADMQVLDSPELALLGRDATTPQAMLQASQGMPLIAAAVGKKIRLQGQEAVRDIAERHVIKIDVDRLDALIDLVGELVIAGATANLVAKIKRDQRFQEATQALSDLVEKIRDTALTFRMVRINEIFQRFPRVIREISRELGKEVELVITGEDTEVDTSMMEKISNPLMHLVRNAIDHGIEPAAERIAAGKDKKGRITLHARHESGSIVIEIADDGRGIDQKKVLAKAIEQGLVQESDVLAPADILNLVFMPGFSTADKITAISGRGVGMDVVKRNIDQLQGKVMIHSVHGKGTTMRIRLPLTLAIISGFQIIVGDMVFVLPLDMVVECINVGACPISNNIVTLRGEALTFINMRTLFDLPQRDMPRKNMLVVQYADARVGLMVDELQGECQAVVKPLSKLFIKMKGLSGSAILGDGRIALILDVPHLVEYAKQSEQTVLSTPGLSTR